MLDIGKVRELASKSRENEAKKITPHNVKVERVRQRRALGLPVKQPKPEATRQNEHKGYFGSGENMPKCKKWLSNPSTGEPRQCGQACVSGYDYCRHHITRAQRISLGKTRKSARPEERLGRKLSKHIKKGEIILSDNAWNQPIWLAASEAVALCPRDPTPGSKLSGLDRAKLQVLRGDTEGVIPVRERGRRRKWFHSHMQEMLEAWSEFEHGRPARWIEFTRAAKQAGVSTPATDRRPSGLSTAVP